jgi:hypothetical protein
VTQEFLRKEGLGHVREKPGGIVSIRVPGHHAFRELAAFFGLAPENPNAPGSLLNAKAGILDALFDLAAIALFALHL